MRNHLTVDAARSATLAVSRDQLRRVAQRMAPQSYGALCERMFVEPLVVVELDEPCLVVNKPGADNSALIDLLQTLIGPTKIGRPIRCWILERGAHPANWRPVSLEKRVVVKNLREFHVT